MICFSGSWVNFSWYKNGTLSKDPIGNKTQNKGKNDTLFRDGDPQKPPTLSPIAKDVSADVCIRKLLYAQMEKEI